MERSNGCIITALFIHRHTVINIQTHFNVDISNESKMEGGFNYFHMSNGKVFFILQFYSEYKFLYMQYTSYIIRMCIDNKCRIYGERVKKNNNKMICEPIDSNLSSISDFFNDKSFLIQSEFFPYVMILGLYFIEIYPPNKGMC